MSYTGAKPYPIRDGGTGQSSAPTDGQLLIGDGGAFTLANLTAGLNVSITNAPGSITIDSTGVPTLTPVFISRLTSTQSAVTGDGTDYSPIVFDTVDTNIGTAYDNTTGIFTAPSGNDYVFAFGLTLQGILSDNTLMDFKIETSSGRTAHGFYGNPFISSYNGQFVIAQYVSITMSTVETTQVSLTVSNGGKVINVFGDASGNYDSWFAGFLLTGNAGGGGGGGVSVVVDGSGNTVSPIAGAITLVNGANIASLTGSPGHITFSLNGTTQYALQVGSASGSLQSLAVGMSGQPLLSGGAGVNPAFGNLGVSTGGTGASTFTAHSVLLGEGSSAISSVGPGAANLPLIGQGAADPIFSVLPVAGGGSGTNTLTGVLIGNGTSAFSTSSITQYNIIVGDTGNQLANIDPGTATWVLTSNGAGMNPSFQPATGGGGTLSTITDGSGNAVSPTANNITLVNGTNVYSLSSAPSTITFDIQGTINHAIQLGNASGNLTSLSLGTAGQPLLSGGAAANPAFGTLTVPFGGTSLTTLTNHAVILGQGASAVAFAAPGVAGTILTSNGVAADPTFQALSGTAIVATITDGSGNIVSPTAGNVTLVNGNNVSSLSGSGSHITFNLTGTTNHTVQIGNASGSLTSLGLGTSGQALVSGGAGDPAFGVTSVIGGGTGVATLTAHGVLLGQGTSNVTAVAPGTSGLPLVANGAADPSYQVLPVSGGGTGGATLTGVITGNATSAFTASAVTQYAVLVGDASNLIQSVSPSTAGLVLASTGASSNPSFQLVQGMYLPLDVTTATQAMTVQMAYATDRAGGVVYTLPATAAFGDEIKVAGKLGISTITPNANQQILIGSASGTVGVTGTAVSTNVGDCIELFCITGGANSIWRATTMMGNWILT